MSVSISCWSVHSHPTKKGIYSIRKEAQDAKNALKGYEVLDVNLNSNAGGWASKGEKAIYLGYKPTNSDL